MTSGVERAGLLGAIVAATRVVVAERRARVPLARLERRIAQQTRSDTRFRDAIAVPDRINVIAECKRRSPARGVLRQGYDPAPLAQVYARGGAAAVSVLTEPAFFGGEPEHLTAVRQAVTIPVLRKDFIIGEYQLFEARAWGADAVLLIVAALESAVLTRLLETASSLDLDAMVEVHTEEEMRRASEAGAAIVGINNRDLQTLDVTLDACARLRECAPEGAVLVAESGIQSEADVDRLVRLGYHAFLIGEWLVSSADPLSILRSLGSRYGQPGDMLSRGDRH
jgi:indole-3-glycerol phosphate synthase